MKNQSDEFVKYAMKHKGISSLALHNFNKHSMNPMSMGNMVNYPTSMTPNVMEERQLNVVQLDVFSRLMMDRIIFLGLPIDSMISNIINAQLLFLQSVDNKKDIHMYINSPGGSVYDGLGVYDVMQYVSPKIATVNTGMAASMAFVLMIAGAKGQRASLPHARFMQHQPMGGAYGQASDIEITHNEIQKLKKDLYDIIVTHTGQTFDKITADCDRDYYMRAEEAKAYGCVDVIFNAKVKK